MKKVISMIMSVVMILSVMAGYSITANASVVRDTSYADDTENYKMLNISGTEYYAQAFKVLSRVNTKRSSNLTMDKDLLEAAMLRAHEISVLYDANYRPNSDFWNYVIDNSDSPTPYYEYIIVSSSVDVASGVADAWIKSFEEELTDTQFKSAGAGCFKSNSDGLFYWTFIISNEAAFNKVTSSKYSDTVTKTETIALYKDYWEAWDEVHKHSYVVTSVVTPASATKKTNGKVKKTCSVCGKVITSTVNYPKTVTLSATSYTYDGKVKKPTVTVKDSNGKTISSGNYTVSYASGRKNVGKYKVTVKFKGSYEGSLSKTFTIKPKKTSISGVTAKSKGFTVKWSKVTAQTTGYEVQYSTSSSFSSAKTKAVTSNKTTSKSITGLKAKTKYYVRVRTYKTVSGTKYYSAWSAKKTVKTK